MGATKSTCSACGNELGPPHNGSNIVCSSCGATYTPHIISGSEAFDNPADSLTTVSVKTAAISREGAEELLAELDEKISELASDIEVLRSREQGAPLELGCALFGIFSLMILVLAIFATLGRAYFGGPVFYAVLTVALLAGLYRMAPNFFSRTELPRLARKRAQMEITLSRLRNERQRIEKLVS